MDDFITNLTRDFTSLKFRVGESYHWSPSEKEIVYNPNPAKNTNSYWTILHEVGHALLDHKNYNSDFELLQLEVAAWTKAKELGSRYNQKIDSEHIQSCLDTYRDWLHRRSICPTCGNASLQQNATTYSCFNCHTIWKVTAARFCRPYRRIHPSEKEKSPELKTQAIFS